MVVHTLPNIEPTGTGDPGITCGTSAIFEKSRRCLESREKGQFVDPARSFAAL
jgi:hypothetical protein